MVTWNPQLYDDCHSYVSGYGEGLVTLLDPQPWELVLDLGCGTGDLTEIISRRAKFVLGIDSSMEMIERARTKYPNLDFELADARDFSVYSKVDAVFSNAALHWILEQEEVIDRIGDSLKEGGRMVVELGGKGNVENIVNAIRDVLRERGFVENANLNVFYFPSVAEYTELLGRKGFRVKSAELFDRKTFLKGEEGVKNWIKMFGARFLEGLSEADVESVLEDVEEKLRATNFENGNWYADYKRLRVVAYKEN